MVVTDLLKFLLACMFISAFVSGCDEYYRKLELEESTVKVVDYEKEWYG